MTIRGYRRAIVAGTVLATFTLVGLPAAAAPAATAVATASTSVRLITGDQVVLSGHRLAIRPATPDTTFQTYQDASGDQFVLPSTVQPYLGRPVDPALFDVSALIRDGVGTSGRTPVRMSFAAGVAPAAPPGITITSVSGATASGYVATGASLGAALRKQIGADVAEGHRAGTAPLFGGLTALRLDAAGPPVVAHPRFPLHVLQINATDSTGTPVDFAAALLLDTDSFTRADDLVPIASGIGRVAVPAGNYALFGMFTDFDANGNPIASRAVTLNDFVVAESGTTTVSLDARTATSQVSVRTPRPAAPDQIVTSFVRTDATGAAFTASSVSFGSMPVFVNAVPVARVGALRYVVQWVACRRPNRAIPTGSTWRSAPTTSRPTSRSSCDRTRSPWCTSVSRPTRPARAARCCPASRAGNARGWTESAWIGAGSGCSAWIDKPSWQHDPNCPGRMVADVAADADPNTGPAVYDAHDGLGWIVVGGTSAASPFIAGVIGLAGNPGRYADASWFYQHATGLNDVTSGNDALITDCGGDYQCNGTVGYDGPTGNGTPHGIAAF